jgi:predicted nucleic acid-binding protein
MAPVYFETSVFLAILSRQPEAAAVRNLLSELKADKVRIYTSILTVQEVSVSAFTHGGVFTDNHTKLAKLARIKGVTKEIALTAAKFEADVIAAAKRGAPRSDHDRIADNRRRKFDIFHLATAVALNCGVLYTFDEQFSSRCTACGVTLRVLKPEPRTRNLLDQLQSTPPISTSKRAAASRSSPSKTRVDREK